MVEILMGTSVANTIHGNFVSDLQPPYLVMHEEKIYYVVCDDFRT